MNELVLNNAIIWVGDGTQLRGHVALANGHITHVSNSPYHGPKPTLDLTGFALSPGLIDSMVLGGFGLSVLHHDPLDIARRYLRLGVTACQFCAGNRPWDAIGTISRSVSQARATDDPDAARVLGIYWEGPFQNPRNCGANAVDLVRPPTHQVVQQMLDIAGEAMTMINVSPGVEGDAAAVAQLRAAGKIVTMAHSDAPADQVLACIEAGTSICGHCWNNNNGALAEPGVQLPTLEHVALTDDRIRFVHLICDGVHVHPILVRMVHRCRGFAGLCLVTDAVKQAGCPDGPYTHDDGRQFTKQGSVGRTDKGGLCGSGLLLPDHLRNFMQFTSSPPHKAIQTVTLNPATSLGLENKIGRIAPGLAADLVAWDNHMRVRKVWRAGQEITNIESDSAIDISPVTFSS